MTFNSNLKKFKYFLWGKFQFVSYKMLPAYTQCLPVHTVEIVQNKSKASVCISPSCTQIKNRSGTAYVSGVEQNKLPVPPLRTLHNHIQNLALHILASLLFRSHRESLPRAVVSRILQSQWIQNTGEAHHPGNHSGMCLLSSLQVRGHILTAHAYYEFPGRVFVWCSLIIHFIWRHIHRKISLIIRREI